jgi:hypothetical protein
VRLAPREVKFRGLTPRKVSMGSVYVRKENLKSKKKFLDILILFSLGF